MPIHEKAADPKLEAHRRRMRELIDEARIERERNPNAPKWGEFGPTATWGQTDK